MGSLEWPDPARRWEEAEREQGISGAGMRWIEEGKGPTADELRLEDLQLDIIRRVMAAPGQNGVAVLEARARVSLKARLQGRRLNAKWRWSRSNSSTTAAPANRTGKRPPEQRWLERLPDCRVAAAGHVVSRWRRPNGASHSDLLIRG